MEDINYILRLKQVMKITGLSRSSIYARMKKDFPQSIKLGERSVGWLDIDIKNWVLARVSIKNGIKPIMQYAVGGHND